jgi:hypothetical protein
MRELAFAAQSAASQAHGLFGNPSSRLLRNQPRFHSFENAISSSFNEAAKRVQVAP